MNSVFNNPKLLSRIKGVIQAGASIGEEISEWEKAKLPNQVFIEPIHELFGILEQKAKSQSHSPNVVCYNIALSDFDGESEFHISTDSFCSSSLLDFSKEAVRYGQTLQTESVRKVPTRRLDSMVDEGLIDLSRYNMLFVDVQGCEYKLMKGAERSLQKIDFVFVEVNFIPLYDGITLWPEFNPYMLSQGFHLVNLRPLEGSQGAQGEALYFNKNFQWK